MNKNLLYVLIFFLILVVLFWLMPNRKINVIDNFFEKILTISYTIFGANGIKTVMNNYKK